MKLLMTAVSLCFALARGRAGAGAPSGQDAVAMVERGVALVKAKGEAKGKADMVRRINARDKEFVQGALFLGMRDLQTGIVLAHPFDPAIVGKDLGGMSDTHATAYRRQILALAQSRGKGWVDNPQCKRAGGSGEPASTYLQRIDDVLLEAGTVNKQASSK